MIEVIQDADRRFIITENGAKILGHTKDRVYALKVAKGHAVKRHLNRIKWLGKHLFIIGIK